MGTNTFKLMTWIDIICLVSMDTPILALTSHPSWSGCKLHAVVGIVGTWFRTGGFIPLRKFNSYISLMSPLSCQMSLYS